MHFLKILSQIRLHYLDILLLVVLVCNRYSYLQHNLN